MLPGWLACTKTGEIWNRRKTVYKALEHNRNDKQLNFQYAQILRAIDTSDSEELAYHFRTAFSKWDDNYEAQFWYARYAFESDDPEKRREAKEIFRRLRNIQMEHDARTKVRDSISNGSPHPTRFTGTVSRMEIAHGFVTADGRGEDVFFHISQADGSVWDNLRQGKRIAFDIGFTFRGPLALNIQAA